MIKLIMLSIFSLIFLAIGFFCFINFRKERKIINDPLTMIVEGRLIGHKEGVITSRNSKGIRTKTKVFYPIYEYEDDGETKTFTDETATTSKKNIGDISLLYINKDGKIITKSSAYITLICSIIFTAIGLFILAINLFFPYFLKYTSEM